MPAMRRLCGPRRLILYLPPTVLLAAALPYLSPLTKQWFVAFAIHGLAKPELLIPAAALTVAASAVILGPYRYFLEPALTKAVGVRDIWSQQTCGYCGRVYHISPRLRWQNDLFCSRRCLRLASEQPRWKGPAIPEPFQRLAGILSSWNGQAKRDSLRES